MQKNEVMSTRRILLVEDDPVGRTLLGAILEAAGYSVVAAGNGREALDLLRDGEKPFVILLDVKMPVMSGREFREEQNRDPVLANIPVFVLSGDSELDESVVSLGAACYFSKPVDPDEMLAKLRALGPAAE
jgi:CheY-like chemotaxis protein